MNIILFLLTYALDMAVVPHNDRWVYRFCTMTSGYGRLEKGREKVRMLYETITYTHTHTRTHAYAHAHAHAHARLTN
jgi:hypothetical protein